jgi:hypothetical protein
VRQIVLPNGFKPRSYQNEVMAYFDKGGTRACTVWHRRAGKDTSAIHQIAKMAHQKRGLYWHMLPTQRQGRKVVWDAFNKTGERLVDQALPRELRMGEANNTEMKVQLKCGSMYQVVGSDNYDSLVGANPIGVVFSEWSLTDPRIWDYVRPILLENGGWAWFIYTPRGYNHGFELWETARKSSDWFHSMRTVDDTNVITTEQIEKERTDGMPEELIQQEFYCSFSAANVGAILGHAMETAEKEGRIVQEELYKSDGPAVEVSCDLGYRDTAAFWFWQTGRTGIKLIDYQEEIGTDADYWIHHLQTLTWNLGTIYLPHDARASTFQTKHSVLEQFLKAGFKVRLVPKVHTIDRINAARTVIKHCMFYEPRCQYGLKSLRDWAFKWDDVRRTFSKDPDHNWASHGADAFSYGALMMSDKLKEWEAKQPKKAEAQENPAVGNHYAFNLDQLFNDQESIRQRL